MRWECLRNSPSNNSFHLSAPVFSLREMGNCGRYLSVNLWLHRTITFPVKVLCFWKSIEYVLKDWVIFKGYFVAAPCGKSLKETGITFVCIFCPPSPALLMFNINKCCTRIHHRKWKYVINGDMIVELKPRLKCCEQFCLKNYLVVFCC